MKKRVLIFVFLIVFLVGSVNATDYYVDATNGDDSNTGTSEASAWQTITKVNTMSFSPGDNILFKRGEIWREQLNVPSSGAAGNPITFGAYRSGEKPTISGADVVSGWTQISSETLLLFSDGFESGDGSAWDYSYGSHSVTTNAARSSSYGLEFSQANNGYLRDQFASLEPKIKQEYYVQITSESLLDGEGSGLSEIRDDSSGNTDCNVWVHQSGGNLYLDLADFNGVNLETSKAIFIGTWYKIEVEADRDGICKLFVDRNEVDTYTPSIWTSDLEYSLFGTYRGSSTKVAAYYDDCATYEEIVGTNVWQASVTTEPKVVLFDGVLGKRVSNIANIDSANKWFWSSNLLYIYSTSDPDVAFIDPGIEGGKRSIVFDNDGKNYITVQDISAQASNSNGFRHVSASNITYRNIYGAYNWDMGLIFYNTAGPPYQGDVNVLDSTFSYNGNNGVFAGSYLNSVLFKGCIFDHNGQNPDDEFNGGLYLADGYGFADQTSYGIVVENSVTYSNGRDSEGNIVAGPNAGFGIWADTLGSNNGTDPVIFRYNIAYNNRNAGFDLENTPDAIVHSSISYHDGRGIQIETSHASYFAINNKVLGNTVYDALYWGILLVGANTQGTTIKNNVIHTAGTNLLFNENAINVELDNNLYYDTSYNNKWDWHFNVYSTLSEYRQATGQDAHSISADPLFTNPSNNNFHLQSGSPCIDAGTDVGLTQDFDGNPIVGLPDMGAYEYQGMVSMCCPADINTDGVVSMVELMNYISNWKAGSVQMTDLMTAISEWKSGC